MHKQTSGGEKSLFIRHVRADDCEEIWVWRNHPSVRKFSFSQGEILLSDHQVWFDKRIKDKNIVMYILENSNGDKVGQVRFEILPDNIASISVNLNPPFIGRGIGVYVITEATTTFFKEHPTVVLIQADILADNIVSRKVFLKAGFLLQGPEMKHGKEIFVFVIKNET